MKNPYEPKKEWIQEYDNFTEDELKKLEESKIPSIDCFNNFLEYLSILNTSFAEYYQMVLVNNPMLATHKVLRTLTLVIVWQSFYMEMIRRRLKLLKDGYEPKQVYFQYRYTHDKWDNYRNQSLVG